MLWGHFIDLLHTIFISLHTNIYENDSGLGSSFMYPTLPRLFDFLHQILSCFSYLFQEPSRNYIVFDKIHSLTSGSTRYHCLDHRECLPGKPSDTALTLPLELSSLVLYTSSFCTWLKIDSATPRNI